MEYHGKLYGKIEPNTYFPLQETSEDFDKLKAKSHKIDELLNVLNGLVTDVSTLLSENDIEWQQAGYFNEAKSVIKKIQD